MVTVVPTVHIYSTQNETPTECLIHISAACLAPILLATHRSMSPYNRPPLSAFSLPLITTLHRNSKVPHDQCTSFLQQNIQFVISGPQKHFKYLDWGCLWISSTFPFSFPDVLSHNPVSPLSPTFFHSIPTLSMFTQDLPPTVLLTDEHLFKLDMN